MKKIVPSDSMLIPEQAKKVFEGQIFDVYQWPQKMFDGSEATFEMLKRPDTVIIIGVDNDEILIIDDEQPHMGSKLGFPGGRVDEGEETLQAAKRELKEETGYEFSDWRLIEVVQPHSKLEWFVYYFLAQDGKKVADPKLDAGEKITVKTVTFEELRRMVLDKVGYLYNALELFEKANNIEQLKQLDEFEGREIDR